MLTSAELTTAGPSYVSSLTSLVKIIEVDPRALGNRDEIPFPQACKAVFPRVRFPMLSVQCPFIQKSTVFARETYPSPVVCREKIVFTDFFHYFFF